MINIGFVKNYFDVYGNISRNVCIYMINENCNSSKKIQKILIVYYSIVFIVLHLLHMIQTEFFLTAKFYTKYTHNNKVKFYHFTQTHTHACSKYDTN